MTIQISSDGRTFTLQTEKSSYQMMADAHDVLLHLYYGRKIAAENLEERIFRSDVRVCGQSARGWRGQNLFAGCAAAGASGQRGR